MFNNGQNADDSLGNYENCPKYANVYELQKSL